MAVCLVRYDQAWKKLSPVERYFIDDLRRFWIDGPKDAVAEWLKRTMPLSCSKLLAIHEQRRDRDTADRHVALALSWVVHEPKLKDLAKDFGMKDLANVRHILSRVGVDLLKALADVHATTQRDLWHDLSTHLGLKAMQRMVDERGGAKNPGAIEDAVVLASGIFDFENPARFNKLLEMIGSTDELRIRRRFYGLRYEFIRQLIQARME